MAEFPPDCYPFDGAVPIHWFLFMLDESDWVVKFIVPCQNTFARAVVYSVSCSLHVVSTMGWLTTNGAS
jgi:hypothetical protein